jgi:hypothetical protein
VVIWHVSVALLHLPSCSISRAVHHGPPHTQAPCPPIPSSQQAPTRARPPSSAATTPSTSL